MSNPSLDQRVAILERKLTEFMAQGLNGREQRPWLRVAGLFAGDQGMKEIFEEALALREQDRRRARRQTKKPALRRAKS